MYVQSFQFPKLSFRHLPTELQNKLAPNSLFGLCSPGRKVSVTRMSSRKSDNFAVIRCDGVHKTEEEKHDDEYYMKRCVDLAKKAIGCTSPNPMVGCVIVKDGIIVGEGFHPKAGQPHAEVFALRDAGDLAENGTAYVSLEPCNHYGRTPPCTEALIKAKVKRVVVGMVDPNPIVASAGVKKLQDAGIEVKVGVHEEMCKRLNEAYIHQMLTGRPFVTLRYSISLDGHLQNKFGEEVKECGGYYSKLLQEYDAIILSSTALTEKSSLPISNEADAKQPLKIVLLKGPNSNIQILALKTDAASNVLIVSDNNKTVGSEIGSEGTEVVSFDRINLVDILEHCKRQGVCSVLLDFMGDFEDIIEEGLKQNLFQKVIVEVLPLFGGDQSHIDLKGEVKKLTSTVSGTSVLLEGYF